MASTLPIHQAIKFYTESDEYFNNVVQCPCTNVEKWEYIVKPGDITEVQVKRECIDIGYGSDLILNGSFETAGMSALNPADWTLSDAEKVQRANDDPFQGQWELRWNNPTGASSAAQDIATTFLAGETYLLEIYVKVTNPAIAYLTPLQVELGGITVNITPTDEYTKIAIPLVFSLNGINHTITFSHSSIAPSADFMYVDVVVLRKVTYQNNTCPLNLVYNSDFEYGQHKVTGESPVVASFDGWAIIGIVEASLTGGLDGSRCPLFIASGGDLVQINRVMLDGETYRISYWARLENDTEAVNYFEITTADGDLTYNQEFTTEWEQYTFDYTASTDSQLTIAVNSVNIYVDNFEIVLVNPVNNDSQYVYDIDNDKYYPAPPTIDSFENGYNFSYDWETLFGGDTPGCSQIITEFDDYNLVLNSKFALGAGNLFTNWILTPANGTIVQSAAGGLNSTRAIQINNVTQNSNIAQASLFTPGITYTISFWGKYTAGSGGGVGLDSNTSAIGNFVLTTAFKRYSVSFTATGSDSALQFSSSINNSSIILDNIFISGGEGVYYSDLFKYDKANGLCAPEITWYDSSNCFDIDYESGFQNHIRLKDLNFQLLAYPTDDFKKTLNGLESFISRAVVKKQKTLNVTLSPEFIHDRLAIAVRHSNIEVGEIPYCSIEDTTYSPVDSDTGCRLSAAQVILGIEGEILGERSINCE